MTNSSKAKGDRAELEAARIINDLLGVPARRKLGAGRLDDTGDIDGVPDCTVQVVSRSTDVVSVAIVNKPLEAEHQARNADTTYAVVFARIRGGHWRVVMTPEMWATYQREVMT